MRVSYTLRNKETNVASPVMMNLPRPFRPATAVAVFMAQGTFTAEFSTLEQRCASAISRTPTKAWSSRREQLAVVRKSRTQAPGVGGSGCIDRCGPQVLLTTRQQGEIAPPIFSSLAARLMEKPMRLGPAR